MQAVGHDVLAGISEYKPIRSDGLLATRKTISLTNFGHAGNVPRRGGFTVMLYQWIAAWFVSSPEPRYLSIFTTSLRDADKTMLEVESAVCSLALKLLGSHPEVVSRPRQDRAIRIAHPDGRVVDHKLYARIGPHVDWPAADQPFLGEVTFVDVQKINKLTWDLFRPMFRRRTRERYMVKSLVRQKLGVAKEGTLAGWMGDELMGYLQ